MRAEDRFGWLDDEAAEDLLRGDLVDDASSTLSADAEELTKVLEGLAVGHQPRECAKELPGEAAALAAFRASRSQKCPGEGREPRTGRSGRVSRAMRGSGAPLRAGLVMTLAGFALGGVAVAATNGMLPTPFDEGPAPAPETSEVRGSQPDSRERPDRAPDSAGGGSAAGSDQGTFSDPSAPTDRYGVHSPDTRDVAGADEGSDGDWGAGDETTDKPTTWPHNAPSGNGRESEKPSNPSKPGGKWPPFLDPEKPGVPDRTVVIALCQAYEGDRIESGKRKQLERVAGGPERVTSYCQEHGSPDGDGGDADDGEGDGGDGDAGEGDGDDGAGGGEDGVPEEPGTPTTPGDPDAPGDPGAPDDPGAPGEPEDGEGSSGGTGDSGGAGQAEARSVNAG